MNGHFKYQPASDDRLAHQNIRLRPLSLLDSGLYGFNQKLQEFMNLRDFHTTD